MPLVQLTIDKVASRGTEIQRMLRPLSKIVSGPAWQPRVATSEFVIGTHDGAPPTSNYGEWRFSTPNRNIRGSYHEKWLKYAEANGDEYWYLHNAYLQLYFFNRHTEDESELLLLHCDPNEPDTADHAEYKKGPHLHVGKAVSESPFPHVHIALTLGHLDAVLKDKNSLFEAMSLAITMIVDEVLGLYSRQ